MGGGGLDSNRPPPLGVVKKGTAWRAATLNTPKWGLKALKHAICWEQKVMKSSKDGQRRGHTIRE